MRTADGDTYKKNKIGIITRRRLTMSPEAVERGFVNCDTASFSFAFAMIPEILSIALDKIRGNSENNSIFDSIVRARIPESFHNQIWNFTTVEVRVNIAARQSWHLKLTSQNPAYLPGSVISCKSAVGFTASSTAVFPSPCFFQRDPADAVAESTARTFPEVL